MLRDEALGLCAWRNAVLGLFGEGGGGPGDKGHMSSDRVVVTCDHTAGVWLAE